MFRYIASILRNLGHNQSYIDELLFILRSNYTQKISAIQPFFSRSRTLLDVSTGYGTFLSFLHSQFPHLDIFSFDIDFDTIISASNLGFSVNFLVSNAFSLPFLPQSFDIVLSHNATHDLILDHFSIFDFLDTFFSSLRSRGIFIIIDKVTDYCSLNCLDYQLELLQHHLFKLANKHVFGLKKSRELEAIISKYSNDYHTELINLDSHPLYLEFAKVFYGKEHWNNLLSLVPLSKRPLAQDLIEDFTQKLNDNYFSPDFLPSAIFVGTKG